MVIVGAGPAGLACARKLAVSGARVLVLEKNKSVGPKICAGGLTGKTMEKIRLPQSLVGRSFREITFSTPLQTLHLSSDETLIHTVERRALGQYQLGLVKEAGGTVLTGMRVTGFGENRVCTDSKTYRFSRLVGADGSLSFVRRALGLKKVKPSYAFHYLLPFHDDEELCISYDSGRFNSWYAWLFPHEGYTSTGCGCGPGIRSPGELRRIFGRWLKRRGIDVSGCRFEAWPLCCDYGGYRFGNVFLAGDAAGLASALTGEGIYQALVSGEEVAKHILLSGYHSGPMDELLEEKSLHDRVLRGLVGSGPFRAPILELAALLMRVRGVKKRVLRTACGTS